MRPKDLYQQKQDDNLVIISNDAYFNEYESVDHQNIDFGHDNNNNNNQNVRSMRIPPNITTRIVNRCEAIKTNSANNENPWKHFENKIKLNLEAFDSMRKFCAYCGQRESPPDSKKSTILGRCYGCQMVYYCSQEHQHLDWIENHMPKCAELEWVSLCELVDSIPVDLLLLIFNDLQSAYWPEHDSYRCNTWTDWFEIRPSCIETVTELARTLFTENFVHLNKSFFLNRREPSLADLVDGILARVTDTMTYALTIGDCLLKAGMSPNLKPMCIHVIYPPEDLIEDLVNFFELAAMGNPDEENSEKVFSNRLDQFYELVNMFPNNCGFDFVFIADLSAYPNLNVLNNDTTKINWSKMTYLRKNFANIYNFLVTFWQGNYSNYIKYSNQIEEFYTKPDLVVSFHSGFAQTPKLTAEWTDDLKVILAYNFPCLFTFQDKEEKERAYNVLDGFQAAFLSIQSNQFGSLLLKQIENKPNHIHAKNGFSIAVKGFSAFVEHNPSVNFNLAHLANATNKEEYKHLELSGAHHSNLIG
jgi:hypothetical protein